MFKKFVIKSGLAPGEFSVILFLVFTLITGTLYKFYFTEEKEKFIFNYSDKDSLFSAITENSANNLDEKSVEINSKLLDFSNIELISADSANLKDFKVYINTANAYELEKLPGIGKVIAKRIVEYRIKSKFQNPEDLMMVKGIGTKKFNKLKKYINIEK